MNLLIQKKHLKSKSLKLVGILQEILLIFIYQWQKCNNMKKLLIQLKKQLTLMISMS